MTDLLDPAAPDSVRYRVAQLAEQLTPRQRARLDRLSAQIRTDPDWKEVDYLAYLQSTGGGGVLGLFEDCDFSDARLDGADLTRGLFDRCRLDRSSARGAGLTGARLHDCTAHAADWAGARLYHSAWLAPPDRPSPLRSAPPALFTGGQRVATGGIRAASAGGDGRVRLWTLTDPTRPRCIRAFELLPDGNWVCWEDPDGPRRRGSTGAPAPGAGSAGMPPLPDGKAWMMYPMDAFQPAPS